MEENKKEIKNEYTFQRAYVIYYENNKFLHMVRKLPIKITYISQKQKAIYCYTDYRFEDKVRLQIQRMTQNARFESAPLFDETLNF